MQELLVEIWSQNIEKSYELYYLSPFSVSHGRPLVQLLVLLRCYVTLFP